MVIARSYITFYGCAPRMTLSHSLLSYQDCLEAMDRAMDDPQGGRVRFSTQNAALTFRARCHQARMITRQKNKKIYEDPTHPQHGACIYDELVLRLRRDGEAWYIYLERMTANNIEVEPLSEASALPAPEPQRLLPPPVDGIKRRL